MRRDKRLLMTVWLAFLALGGVFAVLKTVGVFPPRIDYAPVDTRLESGNHVIFVWIPSSGRPTEEDIATIAEARRAFQRYAIAHGSYFSTVGVVVHPRPDVGVSILRQYGHFDEFDVGRSWFNSGLKRYVKDMGADGTLPQVLAVLDSIEMGQRDWTLIRRAELARFVGQTSLDAWASNGYPIPAEDGQAQPDSPNLRSR